VSYVNNAYGIHDTALDGTMNIKDFAGSGSVIKKVLPRYLPGETKQINENFHNNR
jgi:hypothetical protein